MAEKIDINKLIAAEKTRSVKAKAAAKKAAEEAAAKKAKTNYEKAVKAAIQQRNSRVEGYQKSIDDMMFSIKRIAKNIAEGTGGPLDEKELNRLVDSYNNLIETQESVIKEIESLNTDKAKLDVKDGTVTITEPEATELTKSVSTFGNLESLGKSPETSDKSSTSNKGGASKGVAPSKTKKAPYSIDEIYTLVSQNYGPIDTIFKTDPELKDLLLKAIGKDKVPGTSDDYTADQFTRMLENTNWFKSNANAIRQRGFYKRQYEDLRKTTSDLPSLDRTSEYGRGLSAARQKVADAAKSAGISLDTNTLDLVSRDIYDLGYENTPAVIQQQIRSRLKYTPGQMLGGAAGQNLQALKATAAANGLDLDKNFGTQLQTWLQNIDQGESVETYKQIIRSSAKLGLPDKVAGLIDLGVDLDTIYTPYKNIMYQVLEINPESINVNDATLRKAIGPDKEMSLYEWQDFLKQDPRWQYTNNAREAAYSGVQTVLRDFGVMA